MTNATLYLLTLYGSADVDLVDKQFLYTNSVIHHGYLPRPDDFYFTGEGDRPVGWQGTQYATNEGRLVYNPSYDGRKALQFFKSVKANQWVEATRVDPACRAPEACVDDVERFYLASGSGVWVNTRELLKFKDYQDFNDYVGEHCEDDCNLCDALRDTGHDTVAFVRYMYHASGFERYAVELIACVANATCGVCPAMDLRAGAQAESACFCNESTPLLNCNQLRPSECPPWSQHAMDLDRSTVVSAALLVAALVVFLSFICKEARRERRMKLKNEDAVVLEEELELERERERERKRKQAEDDDVVEPEPTS